MGNNHSKNWSIVKEFISKIKLLDPNMLKIIIRSDEKKINENFHL